MIMDKNTIAVTDSDFDVQVIKANHPVLVDFWAPWCGPCVAIAPTLEKLAEQYQGRIAVAKVNVDENPEVAARYGVRSIPFLAMFKDGEVVQSVVGVQPIQNLEKMIEETL